MQPQENVSQNVDNKKEPTNEQQQTITPVVNATNETDSSPVIKSEENQANWKAFREKREADRKAKEEAERIANAKQAEVEALKKALEAITNQPSAPSYQDQYVEETEEARIEKKVQEALQKERIRYQKEREEQEFKELPHKLNQNFADFNQVCSVENMDYLEYHYPELAVPFKTMPESFEKWSALYKTVKRFVPNPDSRRDQARIEKNLQKPMSISSTGTSSPQGTPNAVLTEERKRANWERMQRIKNGLS
jgi:hypothetical protein